MSDAREQVLANIRRALKRSEPLSGATREALSTRTRAHPLAVQPHYAQASVERFVAKIQAVSGMVTRVNSLGDVAAVVEQHVQRFALPHDLLVASDPLLDAIVWSNRFKVEHRRAVGADRVSVTTSFAGVAETGSVVLLSSRFSPTTLNFLPEDHLVVLFEDRIVRHLEDVWQLLRDECEAMPRTVNLITGPSKTGDVDQVLQEGAHGPRRLHVIMVASRQ